MGTALMGTTKCVAFVCCSHCIWKNIVDVATFHFHWRTQRENAFLSAIHRPLLLLPLTHLIHLRLLLICSIIICSLQLSVLCLHLRTVVVCLLLPVGVKVKTFSPDRERERERQRKRERPNERRPTMNDDRYLLVLLSSLLLCAWCVNGLQCN